MRTSKPSGTNKVLIAVFALLLLMMAAIVGFLVFGIVYGNASAGWNFTRRAAVAVSDQKLPLAGVKTIDMRFSSEWVEVLPSDGDAIRVVQYSSRKLEPRYHVKVTADGDAVQIRSGDPHVFLFAFEPDRIEVYLPSSYCEILEVQLESGSLSISDRSFRTLGMQLSSGEIEASNIVVAEDASLALTSGSFELRDLRCENAKLKTSSGEFHFDGMVCQGKADIELTSGEVLGKDLDAQSLRCELSSGSIRIDAGSIGAIDAQCSSGEIRIDTDRMPDEMRLKCMSGNVAVSIPDGEGFVLDYECTSGQIDSAFDLANFHRDNRSGQAHYLDAESPRHYRADVSSGEISIEKH